MSVLQSQIPDFMRLECYAANYSFMLLIMDTIQSGKFSQFGVCVCIGLIHRQQTIPNCLTVLAGFITINAIPGKLHTSVTLQNSMEYSLGNVRKWYSDWSVVEVCMGTTAKNLPMEYATKTTHYVSEIWHHPKC
ncbi:hypothetical protein PROFUN_16028 [Planoprotostelium fungivorum]|uniref:Uncharacterized protein n=1 Tax=Planoprotostelium fungivorum TaxID=1890364 RepID=A0A2P6MTG6_9EUKA|nr:hypothetical protein PROFUN_16028 [Planoprotostelium fungivorum]